MADHSSIPPRSDATIGYQRRVVDEHQFQIPTTMFKEAVLAAIKEQAIKMARAELGEKCKNAPAEVTLPDVHLPTDWTYVTIRLTKLE